MLSASFLGKHPLADLPGRVVPHMLRVAALQHCHPVLFLILPETCNPTLHQPPADFE